MIVQNIGIVLVVLLLGLTESFLAGVGLLKHKKKTGKIFLNTHLASEDGFLDIDGFGTQVVQL